MLDGEAAQQVAAFGTLHASATRTCAMLPHISPHISLNTSPHTCATHLAMCDFASYTVLQLLYWRTCQ